MALVVDAVIRAGLPLPPLPNWPQYTKGGRLITREEVEAGEVFWRGEVYEFESLNGVHPISGGPLEYGWRLQTFNKKRLPRDQALWTLRDHPDLALRISELATDRSLEGTNEARMREFLGTYGPLEWSLLIGPTDRDPDLLISSSELAHRVSDDPRTGAWAFQFWPAAELVASTVATLSRPGDDPLQASLRALDRVPPGSLIRAVLVQVLHLAIDRAQPRPCQGCGRLFVTTDTESEASHRTGWKRRDAQYHAAKCRKAHLERERRKRNRNHSTQDTEASPD